MSANVLSAARAGEILSAAKKTRVLVVGDVMLDQFIWGGVSRISPEAPVPVLDFQRESFMPGGAANVSRNLADLNVPTEIFGAIGRDDAGGQLQLLLNRQGIRCAGLVKSAGRHTSVKTRVVAHQQQVVRIDRETRENLDAGLTRRLLNALTPRLARADAVIIGDYGKGVVTQPLLDEIKTLCRERGLWLSLDPKPVHHLDLSHLSLITPNRKEAFELAELPDETRQANPLADKNLLRVVEKLLDQPPGSLRRFRRGRHRHCHVHPGHRRRGLATGGRLSRQSRRRNCGRQSRHRHHHPGRINPQFWPRLNVAGKRPGRFPL